MWRRQNSVEVACWAGYGAINRLVHLCIVFGGNQLPIFEGVA